MYWIATVVSVLIFISYFSIYDTDEIQFKVKQETTLSAHEQMQEKCRVSFPTSHDVSIHLSASNPSLGLADLSLSFSFLK